MTAVTVTIDDEHRDRIDEIAAELRRGGMRVDQVLRAIGAICGSVPADRRTVLGSVAGVASVEDATVFQLPPPDSDIQ